MIEVVCTYLFFFMMTVIFSPNIGNTKNPDLVAFLAPVFLTLAYYGMNL